MSHTTRVSNVAIRDIRALRSAVLDLQQKGINCELLENTKPRMYSRGQEVQCDFVLRIPESPYDVGFEKQADGSYSPMFDEFCGHVGKQIGAACPMPNTKEGRVQHQIGQVMQNYAKHAALNAARDKGYSVQDCSVDAQGNVKIKINGF